LKMKNIQAIIIVLLLIFIVFLVLRKNKKEIEWEIRQSVNVVDTIPVRVAPVIFDAPEYFLKTAGRVSSDDEIFLISKVQGTVNRVLVHLGDKVEKGDVLVEVDDYYLNKQYQMHREAYELLKKDYNRYSDLASEGAVTGQQMDQLKVQLEGAKTKMETSRQQLEDASIKATVSGYINQLFVSEGGMIGQGKPVCEIIGRKDSYIRSNTSIEDRNKLLKGMEVSIITNFNHGSRYSGSIMEIGIKPDRTGSIPLSISMSEKDSALLPGTIVNIEIPVKEPPALQIPYDALVSYKGKQGVFVQEKGRAQFRDIQYRYLNERTIIVEEGLTDKDIVITDGKNLLDDGDPIHVFDRNNMN
jgi:membrane fusion protein (multidrug efflux system)